MNIHKIGDNLDISDAFAAASRNAGAVNSTGIALAGYKGDVHLHISVGSVGAAGTLDVKLQESDDDSTYTDVASGAATQITAAGSATLRKAVRAFTKKYYRVTATVGTNAVVFGVTQILNPVDLG